MLFAAINTVKDFVMGRLGDMEREERGKDDTAIANAVVHLSEGDFEDAVLHSSSLWLVEFCSSRWGVQRDMTLYQCIVTHALKLDCKVRKFNFCNCITYNC